MVKYLPAFMPQRLQRHLLNDPLTNPVSMAIMRLTLLFVLITLQTLWYASGHAIHNPIIPGCNPDPAIVPAGSEYSLLPRQWNTGGNPIYRSTDLEHWELWELCSHALNRPEKVQLNGVPTGAGISFF